MKYDALLEWDLGPAAGRTEPAEPAQEGVAISPHLWEFVRVLHNGTHLWKCGKCGSETWTNVMDRDPPSSGALSNSGIPESCDYALVANLMEEKTFGHR